MAKNNSPARTDRESIETPATRDKGSSPEGGATRKAPATSVSVHRIASSMNWVSPASGIPPPLGLPTVRVPRHGLLLRARCQTLVGATPAAPLPARQRQAYDRSKLALFHGLCPPAARCRRLWPERMQARLLFHGPVRPGISRSLFEAQRGCR